MTTATRGPSCPRETMRALPGALQPFLTWMTGKPLPGEAPTIRWTPLRRGLWTAIVLALGVALALAATGPVWSTSPAAGAALLVVAWILTTGSMRMLYVVIEHSCTHNAFAPTPRLNRAFGEIISTVLWATPYQLFRDGHRVHHTATRTMSDPDVHFLFGTGYRRSMTKADFWRYLARTLVSPRYHAVYLYNRLKDNFTAAPYRAVMAGTYLAILVSVLTLGDAWLPWLLAWGIPVTVLFQVSSLINYHSEHRWPQGTETGRLAKARLSYGRFCGDAAPADDRRSGPARLVAWAIWWLRVALVHVPYRLFVLVGDLPQHDLHHRRPGADWANAAYARRDDVAAGCPGWPEDYTEVWGTALDHLAESVRDWDERFGSPAPNDFRDPRARTPGGTMPAAASV